MRVLMKSIENLSVVVTGGTRGIGRAIVEKLLLMGFSVIATGRRDTLERNSGGELPSKVTWLDLDLNNQSDISSFLKQLNKVGPIYGLVNNAGINIIKDLSAVSINDYDAVMGVNLRGAYFLSQGIAKSMMVNGVGRIVNISSIWSVISKPERSLYSAAKAGLSGLTRSLAVELADWNILVNALSPGFTNTELTASSLTPSCKSEILHQIPLKRFAEPSEIAEIVGFLVSPSNTYITGQNIVIDGGFSVI